jgi:hypothetical protein
MCETTYVMIRYNFFISFFLFQTQKLEWTKYGHWWARKRDTFDFGLVLVDELYNMIFFHIVALNTLFMKAPFHINERIKIKIKCISDIAKKNFLHAILSRWSTFWKIKLINEHKHVFFFNIFQSISFFYLYFFREIKQLFFEEMEMKNENEMIAIRGRWIAQDSRQIRMKWNQRIHERCLQWRQLEKKVTARW